jgi:hypothetical protein
VVVLWVSTHVPILFAVVLGNIVVPVDFMIVAPTQTVFFPGGAPSVAVAAATPLTVVFDVDGPLSRLVSF